MGELIVGTLQRKMPRRTETIHVHLGNDPNARASVGRMLEADGRKATFIDEGTLPEALPDIDVLLCGWAPRIDWTAAKKLRLIHCMGAGIDYLLPATGLAEEVVIANARGIHAAEMRDHTLAMMLAFERDLPRVFKQQAARQWEPFMPGSLSGRTLGLVGLGEVGKPIAAAGKALGMRVVGVRRTETHTPFVDEIHPPERLPLVLRASDYLVVSAPLTSQTRGLLDAAALAEMKPEAVLIMLSRGGIVDEPALFSALRTGKLRGAALDVFGKEPLPPMSPLWAAPNLIITPHIAGWMPGYVERAIALFLTNLDRFDEGQPVLTPVDRDNGY